MNRKEIRSKRNGILFGLTAFILLLIVGLSYAQWKQYAAANAQAVQTREIVQSVDRLLLSLIEAETGQRGFLLTGENRYLEPYNQATQTVPTELAKLRSLVASQPAEPGNVERLSRLVDQKMSELGQTISLRKTQGIDPALDVVLSDQGRKTMDEIRGLCTEIQRTQNLSETKASIDGEAAARTTLLATVIGALVMLSFFAFGLEPVTVRDPLVKARPWPIAYSAAVLATITAISLRLALIPVIGSESTRYTVLFLAVLFSAWYGGLRAGLLSILISALAADYYLVPPTHTLGLIDPRDQIDLLIFIVVGFGMVLLSHSQRRALERADQETTLRRSIELAERAERQRFETTLASIGDAVIATDADGRVSFMNDVAASLMGWEPDEASGMPLEEVFSIVNEESRQPVSNPALLAAQEGQTVGLANHTVLIARNGTEIPIDDSGAAIKDPDGKTLGAVLIFRDITERRRLERERGAAGIAARRLAAIVESCDDAIVGKDLNLCVTSWNQAAERMFGYTASEAIGQSILFIVPKDRLSEEEEVMRRIRSGEKVEHLETERRRRDGSLIDVSLTISPIRDESGIIVGASKIARDITERKRAAEAEREARRIAEEANRAKDDFLAMLSHELRNPLSAILGWTVILRKEPMPSGHARRGLEVIERNVRLEAQLVESLLDLSRFSAGKFKLESDRVNLSTILASVVDSARPSTDGKGLALSLAMPPEPVFLIGDATRLQQVFSNVVGNAVKFTPTGGHVEIRLIRAGSSAQVQVIDDGEGISADFIPHIFDRFRQAESSKSRTHGGLGLGLAIVRELVLAHGGTITAESPGRGHGSRFTVTFPIAAVVPAEIETTAVPSTVAGEPSISNVRILVVDDDDEARELVALTLESRGAVVQLASSAAEALGTISQERPDVMIADISMPLEDGYVLIQKLRALEREQSQKRLPAVALTAYAGNADRDQALAAGYDHHLTKPVGPSDLARAVAKFAATRWTSSTK